MKRYPLFVVLDCEGTVRGMFQPSKVDRPNFKLVYGVAREEARYFGGYVEIMPVMEKE